MNKTRLVLWLQLIAGLILSTVGLIISFYGAIIFHIKYSGFSLFDIGSSGDNSPVTLSLAWIFTVLIIIFPVTIWFLLKKFGQLKYLGRKANLVILIIFICLPVIVYVGFTVIQKIQSKVNDLNAVTRFCQIKNGTNEMNLNGEKFRVTCKNGIQDGPEVSYFLSGKPKNYTDYKNGIQEGLEVYYDESGNTNLYIINHTGTSTQIYFQIPEKNLPVEFPPDSQKYYCEHRTQSDQYSCSDNLMTGVYSDGRVTAHLTDGKLDGIYQQYVYGKTMNDKQLVRQLNYKMGVLDGKVYEYSEGNLEYEGQYLNGLQEGNFKRYDYLSQIESEVVFVDGLITKVMLPVLK